MVLELVISVNILDEVLEVLEDVVDVVVVIGVLEDLLSVFLAIGFYFVILLFFPKAFDGVSFDFQLGQVELVCFSVAHQKLVIVIFSSGKHLVLVQLSDFVDGGGFPIEFLYSILQRGLRTIQRIEGIEV